MQKNDKGQIMIRSVKDLPHSARKKAYQCAAGMGALALVISGFLILSLEIAAEENHMLSVFAEDWIMISAMSCIAIGLASYVGLRIAIYALGYALPTQQQVWENHISQGQAFYTSDVTHYPSSSWHDSYTSVNPGSGLPMSGSSGVDASGNPFGTSSWRS